MLQAGQHIFLCESGFGFGKDRHECIADFSVAPSSGALAVSHGAVQAAAAQTSGFVQMSNDGAGLQGSNTSLLMTPPQCHGADPQRDEQQGNNDNKGDNHLDSIQHEFLYRGTIVLGVLFNGLFRYFEE